jgi:microcystin-dependent protein
MSDPFLGEIRPFPFNFAPRGWAFCNGQILSISQNTALFSLLGTFYGGNGQTTFGVPNLQGRAPLHQGQGPGLSEHFIGEPGGEAAVTLTGSELPAHPHAARCSSVPGLQPGPVNNVWSPLPARPTPPPVYSDAGPNVAMNPGALAQAGGSQPHNNLSPYLGLNFCICLEGIFPARN